MKAMLLKHALVDLFTAMLSARECGDEETEDNFAKAIMDVQNRFGVQLVHINGRYCLHNRPDPDIEHRGPRETDGFVGWEQEEPRI